MTLPRKPLPSSNHHFLAGGGEMGERARNFDWSQTSLGRPDQWPQSLRTAVSILLHSQFPMFVWWGKELTTIYNDSYKIIAGDKHPGLLGQSGREAWVEIWDDLAALVEKVFSGASTWSEDLLLYINRQDFVEETYFTFSYSPIVDEFGAVGGLFCAVVETTEKVVSKKKVEESEARFRNMVEQAPVAIALTRGMEVVVDSINDAMLDIMNKKSKEEVLGKKMIEVLPEMEGQAILAIAKTTMETGNVFRGTAVPAQLVVDGEKEDRYFDVTYTPLSEEGIINSLLHVVIDVIEQVQARKNLEEKQEALKRFKFMADHAQDPFILMREDGTFAYLNPKALEAWGYTQAEATYLRVPDTDPNYDDEAFRGLFARAQKEAVPQFETLHKRKDGTTYPVELSIGSIILESKPHMFAVARDITGQVAARQQIEQREMEAHLLAQQLAAANQELRAANEELAMNNGKLLRTNADLDTFVYTASHDLKAPILNIEGLLKASEKQLNAQLQLPRRVEQIYHLLYESVNRFKETIKDLTDVARLGKESEEDFSHVSLEELLQEVLLDMEPQIREAQADIVQRLDCPTLRFSRKNLKSVLYNLVSNAIKYRSPDRKPLIHITCRMEKDHQALSVRDNGLGIDMGQEEKLFALFKRLHNHVEGTGIGLYIVRRIVDNAGGRIEVDSQVGVGSTFTVYFRQ